MRYKHYNKHLYQAAASKIPGVFLLGFLLCLLFPVKPGKVTFIHIQNSMSVSIPKSSALIAAIKDSQYKNYSIDVSEFDVLNDLKSEDLKADENYNRPRVINFEEGMSLRKEDYILGKVKYIDSTNGALKITKAEVKEFESNEDSFLKENQDFNKWINIAREEEKKKIIASLGAANNPRLYNRLSSLDYNELTNIREDSDYSDDPVINEIEKNIDNAFEKKPESNIVVAANVPSNNTYSWSEQIQAPNEKKPEGGVHKDPPRTESNPKPNLKNKIAKKDSGQSDLISSLYNFGNEPENQSLMTSGYSFESLDVANKEQDELSVERRIQGSLEFGNGLAYLGPGSHLDIFHIDRDGNKTKAEVDLSRAEFWLDVKSNLNQLVGEYRDASGQLLGFLQTSVVKLAEKAKVNLRMLPVSWGLSLELIGKLKNEATRLWVDGIEVQTINNQIFIDESWTHYSNFLLSLKSNSSSALNQVVSARAKNRLEVYEKSHLEALAEILRDQGHHMDLALGVVIGEIKNLENLSGFEVEITDDQAIGPIYFNDFLIPDSRLKKTSYSGMFMYVNVSPDNHQVRVRNKDIVVSSLSAVNYNSVTKYDFDLSKTKKLNISAYDVKSNQIIKANFQLPGTDDLFQSDLLEEVTYTYLENKAYQSLEFWAGEAYLPTRWSFSDRRNFVGKKLLPSLPKSILAKELNVEEPILHISMSSPVLGLGINHNNELLRSLKFYGSEDGESIVRISPDDINAYSHVFIQGLPEGLHSIQFQLNDNLRSNAIFQATKASVSFLEP